MAPRVRVGDYVWADPDEPTANGRLVVMRDPARGGQGARARTGCGAGKDVRRAGEAVVARRAHVRAVI